MGERKNDLYPDAYGKWAGRPLGARPDYERCCEQIYIRMGVGGQFSQCSRKRGHGPDEAYCKTHDPAAVAARAQASTEAYIAKSNGERYRWHGPTFYHALKQIAEGHNDARGLAQQVLADFHAGERK